MSVPRDVHVDERGAPDKYYNRVVGGKHSHRWGFPPETPPKAPPVYTPSPAKPPPPPPVRARRVREPGCRAHIWMHTAHICGWDHREAAHSSPARRDAQPEEPKKKDNRWLYTVRVRPGRRGRGLVHARTSARFGHGWRPRCALCVWGPQTAPQLNCRCLLHPRRRARAVPRAVGAPAVAAAPARPCAPAVRRGARARTPVRAAAPSPAVARLPRTRAAARAVTPHTPPNVLTLS